MPDGRVLCFYYHQQNVHTSRLFIFLAAQSGVGIGDPDGQLGCSFHTGRAVLGGDVVSNLGTVRSGRDNQYVGTEACLQGTLFQWEGTSFGSSAQSYSTEGRGADSPDSMVLAASS